MEEQEELIQHYSYYFSDSKEFVKAYLDNYKEMTHILKDIFDNIKGMEKEYKITLGNSGIMFENKKTKESYSIRIEF